MQKECGEATNSFLSEVLYSQNVDIDGHWSLIFPKHMS